MSYVANTRLFLRSLPELEARPIPGTDFGGSPVINPVFSPDGKSIAFYSNTDQNIKKISTSGGAAVVVCATGAATNGTTWGPEGIVFAVQGKGIARCSANGGQLEILVAPKEDEQMEGGQILPGGRAVLFTLAHGANVTTAVWDKAQIVIQDLKTGSRKKVLDGGSAGRYSPSGHLVYAVGGVLYAMAFDPNRQETSGGAVGIVEGVARTNTGGAQYAFSNTGSMIYLPGPVSGVGAGITVLARTDRKGDIEPLKVPAANYLFPRASRDGKRIVYESDDGKEASIWIYELSGAVAPRRLTQAGTGSNRFPIWSWDGQRVAFQSDREGDAGIFWQRADGTGVAERLTKPEKNVTDTPDSWSPDNQRFSFTRVKENRGSVWIHSLPDNKDTLSAEVPSGGASRSVFAPPSGNWIAYQITDGNGAHNFMQTYPSTPTKYQLPVDGNDHHPVFSPDGKEIFYVAGNNIFGVVSINYKPTLTFGPPVRAPRAGFQTQSQINVRTYDVLPDGQHFIGVVPAGQAQTGQGLTELRLVLNWFEDLKQRVPAQ